MMLSMSANYAAFGAAWETRCHQAVGREIRGAEPSASLEFLRQHGPYLYIGTLRVTVRICRELGFRRMADRRLGSMGDRP